MTRKDQEGAGAGMRVRVGKILRVLGGVLLGLVVLLGLLWVLRVPLFGGLVKRELTARLAEALGGRYAIRDVGGSWLGDLRIEGLRTLEPPPDGALVDVAVERAEVDYRLLDLLGDEPLAGLEAIRVEGGRVTLDPSRPASPEGEAPDLEALDAFRGRVDVETDVVVVTGEGPATLRGVRASLGPGRPLALDVEEVVLPERFGVRGPLAGEVERVDADTWAWTSEAVFGGVRVPQATVRRDGRVTATVELAGGRVDVVADTERLEAQVERVDLARLPPWLAARIPDDVERPRAGRVEGSFALAWSAKPVETSFDLTLADVTWLDEHVASARLAGTTSGSRVVVTSLDVTGERLRARGRGLTLDLDLPIPLRAATSLVVEVDSLRTFLPDLPHDASLRLRASSGAADRLRVEELVLWQAAGRIEVRGEVRVPADRERWRRTVVDLDLVGSVDDPAAFELPWSGAVRLVGAVSGEVEHLRVDVTASGDALSVEGRPVDGARLVGTLVGSRLDVSTFEVRAPGVLVVASGEARFDPLRVTDAAWTVAVDDLAAVAPLLPTDAPALRGRLASKGRLAWDGEVLTGTADVEGTGLGVDDASIGDLALSVVADGSGRATVSSLDVEGAWGRLRGRGSVDLAGERATVDALAYAEAGDATPRAALRAPLTLEWRGGEIRLEGGDLDVDAARVRLDARARPADGEAEIVRLEVEHPDARIRLAPRTAVRWGDEVVRIPDLQVTVDEELTARGAVLVDLGAETLQLGTLRVTGPDLDGRLLAPLTVARRGDEVVVDDLDALVGDVHVQAAGRADLATHRAVLEALRVRTADLDARLETPARLAWTEERVAVEELDVALLGGRVRGRAAWDGAPHAVLDVEGMGLARWVEGPSGTLEGRVTVDGERLEVTARVPELAFQAWRGAFQVRAVQDDTGPLRVEHVRLQGPRGGAIEGRAVLPWRVTREGLSDLADAPVDLDLRGGLGGLDLFHDVVDGPVSLRAEGDAEGLRVLLRIADVGLCDASRPCDDVGLDLRITPEAVSGRVALGSDDFLRVRGHVELDRGFDWTRPETLARLVEEATLDAEVDALVASWAPLAEVAPGLRRMEGGTRLVLAARGPLRAPSVEGTLELSNVGIELDTDIAPFEQVDARLVWKDDVIRIDQLEGLMGYAPFRIGGSIRLVPAGVPEADLTIHGRNTQLIRTEWFRMRIDVDANVSGPFDALRIEGEGKVVDAIYREPVSLTGASGVGESPELILFEIEDAPFDRMTFDLAVRADETIRIRNNLIRANVSYEGRLRGTGARPAFEGTASFENADIQLPLTTLRRGRGEIEWLPGSPGRPRIQMTAQTRTKGYEMGVQLAGRLPDVNLHVFTEPPLPEEDALLMLATGSTGAELAEGGILGTALAGAVSVFGGSLFTSRGEGAEPGEKAFFDRFLVEADLDGTTVGELDAEIELNRRFFLHVQRDRFEATDLGLIWRIRFR